MSVLSSPTFALQPSAQKQVLSTNYITNFDFLTQYLPDTYEKEFERYGNRTVASFLRMVGAEMPTNSDMIKWAEQGRLHIKYTNCTSSIAAGVNALATITINDAFDPTLTTGVTTAGLRVGQTIMISDNAAGSTLSNKGVIVGAPGGTKVGGGALAGNEFEIAYYEVTQAVPQTACTVFIYGSEFAKGS